MRTNATRVHPVSRALPAAFASSHFYATSTVPSKVAALLELGFHPSKKQNDDIVSTKNKTQSCIIFFPSLSNTYRLKRRKSLMDSTPSP